MKKLMLSLMIALFGLAITTDAFAGGYYRTGRCWKRCKKECPEVEMACPKKGCVVDKVIEEPCPAVPCCVKYVRVEEPAQITKHISYSAACPSGCTTENKAAGMLTAGEEVQY